MSSAINKMRQWALSTSGQATVEAAFALPILILLFLLLLQPGIVLYDRIVMSSAASEACRLLATSPTTNADINDDFIRRRLAAIPQMDLFHVHRENCSTEIKLLGNESSEDAIVEISTKLKPLPLIDAAMSLTGMTGEDGLLTVHVKATEKTQPLWVSGSREGRNPAGWCG